MNTTTTETTETRYLLVYPRDFANEWAIYSVARWEAPYAKAMIESIVEPGDHMWINKARADRMIRSAVSPAYGEQVFGCSQIDPVSYYVDLPEATP